MALTAKLERAGDQYRIRIYSNSGIIWDSPAGSVKNCSIIDEAELKKRMKFIVQTFKDKEKLQPSGKLDTHIGTEYTETDLGVT